MKDCDVSVIVRTRDRPRLLGRALANISAQTCLPAEILIVNDSGDPERVRQVVAECGGKLRIRVIDHATCRGRAAALNTGLKKAETLWFAVLDDDDTWLPAFLETMISAAEGSSPVVCQSYVVDEQLDAYGEPHETGRRLYNGDFKELCLIDLAGHNRFTINALLCSLEAWRALGGFREDLTVLEDWEFNLRLASRYAIKVVPAPLACYHRRPREGNGSHANSSLAEHAAIQTRLGNEWLRHDLETGRFGFGWLSALGRQQQELQQLPFVGRLKRWRERWHRMRGRSL
jgi:glycosyltransferase involved in cell wall biosynthesis